MIGMAQLSVAPWTSPIVIRRSALEHAASEATLVEDVVVLGAVVTGNVWIAWA
jgi:hypothetical protein